MNTDQTDVGPEIIKLMKFGKQYHEATGDTMVVAPGYSPDYPNQAEPYAEMMARWYRNNGVEDVVVLEAETFNTYGELKVFCETFSGGSVIGFDWHLRRAKILTRHIPSPGINWEERLHWVGLPDPMSRFDRLLEPLKTLNAYLPPERQQQMTRLYKRLVSTRTSY